MAGHNKWSKVKHKKGIADAKKSKIWTKIIREITQAARLGGGDANANPRLRKGIDDARAANMPKENITRAIDKGLGNESENLEELIYEGYGPGGVAIVVECMTNNRNRTLSEVRTAIQKRGGNLGASGSVLFGFHKKGFFTFEKQNKEERLLEIGLEHGLNDISDEGESYSVICDQEYYLSLKEAFIRASLEPKSSEIIMIPDSYVKVSKDNAQRLLSMIEALEDLDDVQNVYSNMDVDELELEELMG